MKKILSVIIIFAFIKIGQAQNYAKLENQTLTLDNGIIKRVIQFSESKYGIVSNSLTLNIDTSEFLIAGSEEFYFEIDGKGLTGLDSWTFVSAQQITAENNGQGIKVILEQSNVKLKIAITYLLYPELPIIRKKIEFTNNSVAEMKLESLDIERVRFMNSDVGTDCWVMHDYARQKSLGQFIGNWYDPAVIVHQVNNRNGIVLGNEAPGVMKRTTAFLKPNLLTIGLTHSDQNFGFRQWIKVGETWESPWVFTGIYANSDEPSEILNGAVSNFVRKHLGTRLSKIKEKPVFVYNTWVPFYQDINEKLIYELVDASAECGIEEFVIDAGWQGSYGDWTTDKLKFPNGLTPVFDHIKSKGMKPGLWISIASVESKSNVFKQHPEWAVHKANGSPINVHNDTESSPGWEFYSMCLASGWRDYIKNIILKLIKENGLEYLKADLAVVSGAYTTDKTRSGCHAKNHSHKDRNESMLEMYQATWKLFDELHEESPNLFIDCTFETMGAFQLIDFDMCKYAEGNWLSNFAEKHPLGSLRIRQMAWWRTPMIPASALVVGNQFIDDAAFEFALMSLAGTLPIVLGDPRKLTKEQRARIKQWADWLRSMQTKYDYMSFRQDLYGFGEPSEGSWDGFQRINSDNTTGGIVGIFRQGSLDNQRTVYINNLAMNSTYEVKKAPNGEKIIVASGNELEEKGFAVKFDKTYDGALFEIHKID